MSVAALEPIGSWTEADRALSATTVEWLGEAQPANTRRAYEWQWGRFTTWCDSCGRSSLPATAETVTEYAATLRGMLASPANIDQALGVILARHRASLLERPETYPARALLRAYRRQLAEDGVTQRQATPMTRDVLCQTIASLDVTSVRGRRDRLMLALGFQMMARRSELAALRFADIAETDRGLEVSVRTSKTDRQSTGRAVALPTQADPALDPVRLVRAWRVEVGDGPLLRRLSIDGIQVGPITGHGINHALRAAVRRAGIPEADTYTAHSLRAGGLTDALLRGVPVSIAARHGGWDPESPTVLRYARAADRWRDNAMAGAF